MHKHEVSSHSDPITKKVMELIQCIDDEFYYKQQFLPLTERVSTLTERVRIQREYLISRVDEIYEEVLYGSVVE